MSNKYNDILHLPRFISKNRKHMSNYDRAAQFAPFAALTGYGEMVHETARLTDSKIELSEDKIEELNLKLTLLQESLSSSPIATITYFEPDEKKEGGSYKKESMTIIKIDAFSQTITTTSKVIPIKQIIEIESE